MRPIADPAPRALVSFIVCSIDPAKLAEARASFAAAFDGTPWELIHIPDATSLAGGYERGRMLARGEYLVFCHDDIVLVAHRFRARLLRALQRADVVGVAGGTHVGGPAWFWSGPPHIHSWVAHRHPTRYMTCLASPKPAFVERAQALDGVFIAARREAADSIRFDPDTFDGWHGYDIDFSHRAHLGGHRVAIAQDLTLVHRSGGKFGADYLRYAAKLCNRFPHFERRRTGGETLFHGAPVDTIDQVRATTGWLDAWTTRLSEEPGPDQAEIASCSR